MIARYLYLEWIQWSGQGQVAGTWKCGYELSGSIKCGEFPD